MRCEFFSGRRSSELLLQAQVALLEAVELVSQVNRETNGPPLVGNSAGDGLTNPPERVGTEFLPFRAVKFLAGAHEPQISFFNKVLPCPTPPLTRFSKPP